MQPSFVPPPGGSESEKRFRSKEKGIQTRMNQFTECELEDSFIEMGSNHNYRSIYNSHSMLAKGGKSICAGTTCLGLEHSGRENLSVQVPCHMGNSKPKYTPLIKHSNGR